jgi:hypothetical protein
MVVLLSDATVRPNPSPSPSPAPASTPTPTPTSTPTPTPTPPPTPTPNPNPTTNPNSIQPPTPTPTPTPTQPTSNSLPKSRGQAHWYPRIPSDEAVRGCRRVHQRREPTQPPPLPKRLGGNNILVLGQHAQRCCFHTDRPRSEPNLSYAYMGIITMVLLPYTIRRTWSAASSSLCRSHATTASRSCSSCAAALSRPHRLRPPSFSTPALDTRSSCSARVCRTVSRPSDTRAR